MVKKQKTKRIYTSNFEMRIADIVIAAAYSKFYEGIVSLTDRLVSASTPGFRIEYGPYTLHYQVTGEYAFAVAPVIIQTGTNPVDVNEVLGNATMGTVRAIIDSACADSLVGYDLTPMKASQLVGFTENPDDEEKYLNVVRGTFRVPRKVLSRLNEETQYGSPYGEYSIGLYGLTEAAQDLQMKCWMQWDSAVVQDKIGLR